MKRWTTKMMSSSTRKRMIEKKDRFFYPRFSYCSLLEQLALRRPSSFLGDRTITVRLL